MLLRIIHCNTAWLKRHTLKIWEYKNVAVSLVQIVH